MVLPQKQRWLGVICDERVQQRIRKAIVDVPIFQKLNQAFKGW